MTLHDQLWLQLAPELGIELAECAEEGKDVSGLAERIEAVQAMPEGDPHRELAAAALLDETLVLPIVPEYPYDEPSDIHTLRGARPEGPRRVAVTLSEAELYDKVYGAWLVRCAGCLLGKPVEGWMRDRIAGLLEATGNYPVKGYLRSDIPDELRRRFDVSDVPAWESDAPVAWLNNIDGGPLDDDTNYTVLNLLVLEKYGSDFTSEQVGLTWLHRLPVLQTCTAERVAYRNMLHLMAPPQSALHHNVYREWIGAQIRADIFGYAAPGGMEAAAGMAWRDARVSHVKNGIYGEMWAAAMLAAAYTTDDAETIIRLGLSEIPARSRLYEAVEGVLAWPDEGLDANAALDRIHELWNEANPHEWCHTISNALVVAVSLLYGGMDLQATFDIALRAGFDTDCNAATAGSVVGLVRGAAALPAAWIEPLDDRLRTAVLGAEHVRLSDVAARTARLAADFIQS